MTVTDGKVHDVAIGRTLKFLKQRILVFDRGYTDYTWYNLLNDNAIFFVTRQKTNATYNVLERRPVTKNSGLTSDQTIKIKGTKAADCPAAVVYQIL